MRHGWRSYHGVCTCERCGPAVAAGESGVCASVCVRVCVSESVCVSVCGVSTLVWDVSCFRVSTPRYWVYNKHDAMCDMTSEWTEHTAGPPAVRAGPGRAPTAMAQEPFPLVRPSSPI